MKADLDDGFLRISLTLEYGMPFFQLTKTEEAVMHLVRASAWGHATRSPGYTCDMTPQEMVAYLDFFYCQAAIYRAINGLRAKHILTADEDTIVINPRCLASLPPEVQDRIALRMQTHNDNKRYSRPALKPIKPDSTYVEKNSTYVESHNKERVRGERENKLKSSSYLATKDLENAVPKPQTADDDDFKAQSQRLRQNLLTLAGKVTRRPEADLAAELDGVGGRTPEQLRLGMARVLSALRAGDLKAVGNLRSLVATASDPNRGGWPNLSQEQIAALAQTAPEAKKPAFDAQAMLAAARALELEQRQNYRP
jgi:hypothetical protein